MSNLAKLMSLNDIKFIFLDDVRMPPSTHWQIVRTAEAAYVAIREAVANDEQIVVSLDHDLGEEVTRDCTRALRTTGYDLLTWIERDIYTEEGFRPNIAFRIHSANPVGRENMDRAIQAIERLLL